MHNPPTKVQSINDFFEIYAHALEIHDTKGMTFLHHIPCTMLSDDAFTIFNESSRLEGFFNQGMTFYKQFGIVYARPDVRTKTELTGRIANVKVTWKYLDADKKPVYSCDYHYVMKQDKNRHWKIMLSVSVNERERMEEWKIKRTEQ